MELWTPSTDLSSRPSDTGFHPGEREAGPRDALFSSWDPGSAHAHGVLVRDDSLLLRAAREHLTTAEILYRLPDYPAMLQTFVWQDYDRAPRFPALRGFLAFWEREIEGPLHCVTVAVRDGIGEARFTLYAAEY